jgi:hypothetical protein
MRDERQVTVMEKRSMGAALCVITLLAFMPIPVAAQDAPIGWEMGLVYEGGASEDNPFTLDESETTIRFWIRNDNLAGDIEISLEYDTSSDGAINGEESVTVGSGANDTFTIQLTGIDVWNIAAGITYDFDIDGELTSWNGAPVVAPISSQSADGDLIIPQLHRWDVDINDIGHPVNAGTEFNLHVDITNVGNTADSISTFSLEDDCPVLTVDDGPLDDVKGELTQPGIVNEVTLVFDASSTHPTRMCEIEITVRSAGVANGGLGDSLNKEELDVEIEARPVGSQQDNDDASVDDDDGPQNQEEVTSDNFLMFPPLVTPMAILWAALMRAREE